MNPQDFEYLAENLDTSGVFGCDSSLTNIFLYEKQYGISTKIRENIFFRTYNQKNQKSYAFPIPLKKASQDYLKTALKIILQTENPALCLISQEQKNKIDEILRNNFPTYHVDWKTDRADADYIYLQKNLAELHGDILQKKKNHVSKFLHTYENQWTFKTYPENDIFQDILVTEQKWLEEKNVQTEPSLLQEQTLIQKTCENAAKLKIRAAVLYVNSTPIAMTMASPINNTVLDIHFEKALSPFSTNGAYAAINNFFAKSAPDFLYFNREEDLGIEGLRKAKLSYKPEILLDKFYGKIISEKN